MALYSVVEKEVWYVVFGWCRSGGGSIGGGGGGGGSGGGKGGGAGAGGF